MPSALGTLAQLLDQAVDQIADASYDARTYDADLITMLAGLWDNSVFPFVAAAGAARPGQRDRLAATELAAMATRIRPREWMVECAPSLDADLPAAAPAGPHRDRAGRAVPGTLPLDEAGAGALAADYDLATAEVRMLRVARSGRRMVARVEVAVPRRYPAEGGPAPATLRFDLDRVGDVRFGLDDAAGCGVRTTDGVEIGLGRRGRIRARAGTVRPDDPAWHRSGAGRAAVPLSGPVGRPGFERPRGAAHEVAAVLHAALLHLRMARYPRTMPDVPFRTFAHTFLGAGTDIVQAGAQGEPGFRRLVDIWTNRSRVAAEPGTATVPEHGTAELHEIRYTAPGEVVALLAVPQRDPRAPWRLAVYALDEVTDLRLGPGAFDAPATVVSGASGIDLADGALFTAR